MGKGIYTSLVEFCEDEGSKSAIEKAETWRDALEEIAEISCDVQRSHVQTVLNFVNSFLRFNA